MLCVALRELRVGILGAVELPGVVVCAGKTQTDQRSDLRSAVAAIEFLETDDIGSGEQRRGSVLEFRRAGLGEGDRHDNNQNGDGQLVGETPPVFGKPLVNRNEFFGDVCRNRLDGFAVDLGLAHG